MGDTFIKTYLTIFDTKNKQIGFVCKDDKCVGGEGGISSETVEEYEICLGSKCVSLLTILTFFIFASLAYTLFFIVSQVKQFFRGVIDAFPREDVVIHSLQSSEFDEENDDQQTLFQSSSSSNPTSTSSAVNAFLFNNNNNRRGADNENNNMYEPLLIESPSDNPLHSTERSSSSFFSSTIELPRTHTNTNNNQLPIPTNQEEDEQEVLLFDDIGNQEEGKIDDENSNQGRERGGSKGLLDGQVFV